MLLQHRCFFVEDLIKVVLVVAVIIAGVIVAGAATVVVGNLVKVVPVALLLLVLW